jgi:hypothetical protein
MDANALRDQLAALHGELAKTDHVDPKLRQLLAEVMADVTRLADGPAAALPPPSPATLADRLETVAVQFEAGHPALGASVRRFVDLLGKVGL